MTRFQRILCPTDFSKSSAHACASAVKLAANHNAAVHLIHAVEPVVAAAYDAPVVVNEITDSLQKAARQQLEKLKTRAARSGIKITTEVQLGDADTEILQAIKAQKSDLVVMGTHGRRGFERFVLGSETERMLRLCPVPLFVVGSQKASRAVSSRIRRILCTTDFSNGTSDAVSHALSIARESNAKLTLLYVAPDLAVEPFDPDREPLIQGIAAEMRRLIPAEASKWCEVDTRVEAGSASEEIPKVVASGKFDLLVMNLHGKSERDRTLIGSTAERTLREVSGTCPVLLVPPRPNAKGKRRAA
jgi:nucleotide-binding universal stress UspA family protein